MRTDRLALLGAVAVTSLAVIVAAMHIIQPGLSPVDHLISEYAYGRLGWLLTSGYVLAGSGTLLLASQLPARSGTGRRSLASGGCLALVGVGLIATGLTRIDVARVDGAVISTVSGQIHELAGYVAVLGLIAAAFVLSATIRRERQRSSGRWSAFRLYRWALPASVAALVIARPLGGSGLGQRAFLALALSWLIYVGIELSRGDAPAMQTTPGRMGDRHR